MNGVAPAKAKTHIICEKPLGNNLKEAKAMADAVKKAGVRHFLMHNYRRAPAVALAKRMVEDGRVGRIFHFRARYLQDWAMSPELPLLWRFEKTQSGSGALGDLGSHIIDLAHHLCGPIAQVSAAMETFIQERPVERGSKTKKKVTVDDAVAMCVRFANGALGTLEATRFALGRKNHNNLEINGGQGSIVSSRESKQLAVLRRGDPPRPRVPRDYRFAQGRHPYRSLGGDGHILGYEHTFTTALTTSSCNTSRRRDPSGLQRRLAQPTGA